VAGAVVVGAANAMVKLTQKDADKIQQTTGKAPEDMSEEELQQAMKQAGVQAQPIMPEDQQAMETAEAADPDQD
jgi:ribosome maturation protein Sdo1